MATGHHPVVSHQMSKRKKEGSDKVEEGERKRKTQLENAKQYIRRTGSSIRATSKLFGVGRESLSIYLQSGYQTLGRPPLLDSENARTLQLYLTTLDTINMQQPLRATGQMIQKLSGSPSAPSMKTVRKYVKENQMKIRKARTSDEGRTHATESIEHFIHYFSVLENCLSEIAHDRNRIFNVDEVGIQVAERKIHLVTGREYLNKNLNQTSIHVTLVLCSSPGQMGSIMTPHFLYQCPEGSERRPEFTGTEDSTCDWNQSGYQDEITWRNWMNLFILWKRNWLVKLGYHPNATVVLLLDGHYSHLNLDVLFTAAKNSVMVVCMLAHATHLVQPNDKTANKRFKQNLDEELESFASNDLVVQNYDLAFLCEKALNRDNMKNAIISSYRQVGVYPYDSQIVLRVIKKYQVHLKSENEKKRLDELKGYLESKVRKRNEAAQAQSERKEATSMIKFGTKTAKVLTSSTCLGRIKLATEWKETKTLKKNELIARMITKYEFLEEDLRKKTVPELKKMAENYLLSKESELVATFQKQLDSVLVPIPSEITNFFEPKESEKEEDDQNVNYLQLENEILSFLQQGPPSATEEEDSFASLLLTVSESLGKDDNRSF